MLSTRHSTGCPGKTSNAFSNRSGTFLQSSSSRCTIATKQLQSPWPESTKTVSGKPGAVQMLVRAFRVEITSATERNLEFPPL